jgi:hypothetical protein
MVPLTRSAGSNLEPNTGNKLYLEGGIPYTIIRRQGIERYEI